MVDLRHKVCLHSVDAFFLNIDILAYYVADIPFEIILVISTILSVMYLFRPLEKILRKQWESI